ncbi:winged helix-turn-helix domain-containing protein [Candidatus Shapirobacteria bacterium]|nr:winged helix-turn-helix domain-containing protein [Candidatus Shapirobacteria bacterium]
MTIPETTWRYDQKTEAARVVQAACQIANRFYLKQGFFVLPRLVPQNPRAVYFPDLNFRQIPEFWEKLKIPHFKIKLDEPKLLVEQVAVLLPKDDLDYTELQEKWQEKERAFWQILADFLPEEYSLVRFLEIRPTKYGSIATSDQPPSRHQPSMKIYIRQDAGPSQLAEAILIGLLTIRLCSQGFYWPEVEAIIDFLLEKTALRKLFLDFRPTLKALRHKENGSLAQESQKYLRKLGVPVGQIFTLEKESIFLDGELLKVRLSLEEERLLRLLILNQDQPVSFDLIGDEVWGERLEKFSLQAIAKLVQRLREKLAEAGLSAELIQTCRGQGYLLLN